MKSIDISDVAYRWLEREAARMIADAAAQGQDIPVLPEHVCDHILFEYIPKDEFFQIEKELADENGTPEIPF